MTPAEAVSGAVSGTLDGTGVRDDVAGRRGHLLVPTVCAVLVFVVWLTIYGFGLFPGLGGQLNAGDSAKFQILGHTPILVHGPGYPLVLLYASILRAFGLPPPEWWMLTFMLSALPGAVANVVAFLIGHRLTGSVVVGLATAFLLGSAALMAVQATEAEVYALTLVFILSTIYLLVLFVETRRLGFFLAACAVYAISFGNHLMMIMLLPVFIWVTLAHRRMVLRPAPVAGIVIFIVLGASQYLYLAYVAHHPATSYSEYMPLPPAPMELVHYILGTYFSALYESGLAVTRVRALLGTLMSAHPWISAPLFVAGIVLFAAGWRRRDAAWHGLAVLYGGALTFVPFALWYGVPDIQAFHLPVVGPLLVAAVATLGWWLKRHPVVVKMVGTVLLVVGVARAGQTAVLLSEREPVFSGLRPALEAMVAQSPVDEPIVAMEYGLRMAALYHELRDELPKPAVYRLHWRAVAEIRNRPSVGGIVVPSDGYQFVDWIEHRRPDMSCRTRALELAEDVKWPAYAFECRSESSQ